jgi:hypothetical protein
MQTSEQNNRLLSIASLPLVRQDRDERPSSPRLLTGEGGAVNEKDDASFGSLDATWTYNPAVVLLSTKTVGRVSCLCRECSWCQSVGFQ